MFSSRFLHSRRGSALLIGMIISLLLSVVVISFADKVLRFSRNTVNIELSTKAYYRATDIIESQMMATEKLKKEPWTIQGTGSLSALRWVKMEAHTGSSIIPSPGYGSSPWNKDYNLIGINQPVQIVLPNSISWNNVDFEFRIPQVEGSSLEFHPDLWPNLSGAIIWTFTHTGGIFFGSGEQNSITFQNLVNEDILLGQKMGIEMIETDAQNFQDFYNAKSHAGACENFRCTLKLSQIRPVKATNGAEMPFLEYKITFPNTVVIPEQYSVLRAQGLEGGYLREREVYIRQITGDTALDFAVLQ